VLRADAREGDIGMHLGEVAKANPAVAIGSPPFFNRASLHRGREHHIRVDQSKRIGPSAIGQASRISPTPSRLPSPRMSLTLVKQLVAQAKRVIEDMLERRQAQSLNVVLSRPTT
jgi:hypothetical protein